MAGAYGGGMGAWAGLHCNGGLAVPLVLPAHLLRSIHPTTHPHVQEARFDRHFVRDLQWSRHQLEELAERRFMAAQMQQQRRKASAVAGSPRAGNGGAEDPKLYSFADLFKAIRVEEFSSYISKLSTPRELMLFMTGGWLGGGAEEGVG